MSAMVVSINSNYGIMQTGIGLTKSTISWFVLFNAQLNHGKGSMQLHTHSINSPSGCLREEMGSWVVDIHLNILNTETFLYKLTLYIIVYIKHKPQ